MISAGQRAPDPDRSGAEHDQLGAGSLPCSQGMLPLLGGDGKGGVMGGKGKRREGIGREGGVEKGGKGVTGSGILSTFNKPISDLI